MRFLLQIVALLVIVVIGWKQPLSDVARKLLPWAQIPPSRLGALQARSARDAPASPTMAVEILSDGSTIPIPIRTGSGGSAPWRVPSSTALSTPVRK